MPKIYALLVGINDYPIEIGKLHGCVNDVDKFHDYLKSAYHVDQLRVELLKNADATRDNIVRQFRAHLCQADQSDVVLFHYSGHGARWASAAEFLRYFPDGKDEGLVCYDSRRNGVYDLADKELALLLAEVASKNPHLAVVMDCCHSGSVTRSGNDFTLGKSRQTHEVLVPRPLETYLDGYYQNLLKDPGTFAIPSSQHVLLSACERGEKAWESKNHGGVFSNTLMDVLEQSSGNISYADLFVRCRAAVRKYASDQNPQFESYNHFNAHGGFLGSEVKRRGPRYSVYFNNDQWNIDCGALHGMPTDVEKKASFTLFTEADHLQKAGHATTACVGAQKSTVALNFTGDPASRYNAEIVSLPAAPVVVYADGDEAGIDAVKAALEKDLSIGAILTEQAQGHRYSIVARDKQLSFSDVDRDLMIQAVRGYDESAAVALLGVIKKVVRWERSLRLQNKATRIDASLVDFWFAEKLDNGEEHRYEGNEITLDFVKEKLLGTFYLRNRTAQKLYVAFTYFSSKFGIHVIYNLEVVPTGDDAVVLWGDNPAQDHFYLEDGQNQSIENIKLFITTEKIDDFLLTQDPCSIGDIIDPQKMRQSKGIGNVPSKKLVSENEWFTLSMTVNVVRQCDEVGVEDARLAGQQIIVRSHPKLSAKLSLLSARTGSRSVAGDVDICNVLESIPPDEGQRPSYELCNLTNARGDGQNVLELTDIHNADSLRDHPLEIALNVPLQKDEFILPLTFDGDHILLGGSVTYDDDGHTLVRIHDVPDVEDNRRSLGGSLKLYFFKTYLKKNHVNLLSWVEYRNDGTINPHREGVAAKVKEAKNILLLVHGIIGDTSGMASSLPLSIDERGSSLLDKFDLVLTYDYENLSTPIEQTALEMGQQLSAVGLGIDDNKHLTLLVHSMGGLVSRWFIEKLGGRAIVNHLVMCGTPNNGSPYGEIESARKLISVLTTISLNAFPVSAPFCVGLLLLINRSKKLTPCLEQMSPSSSFMQQLNSEGSDPGIRYTILAGNVDEFEDDSDVLFAKLLNKVGKSALLENLFGTSAHDIAVSRESVRAIPDTRNPVPVKTNVSCHHLNHFISNAGLEALAQVDWQVHTERHKGSG